MKLSTQIPEGMQDTLPGECKQKRQIEGKLRSLFEAHGFSEAKTPQLEFLDVFTGDVSGINPQQMWKTFDRYGRLIVVRPDNTTPMVRIAATKLRAKSLPIRLCYVQDVLEFPQSGSTKLCEIPQAGVELMGEAGAEADAEIVALAIHSLLEAGLESFQIDIGQVDFFKGLMQEAGLDDDAVEELRRAVEEKNMLSIELLLRGSDVSDAVKKLIMRLPMLYGGQEVLDQAERMTKSQLCRKAVANLRAVMNALGDYGLTKYVSIDLGMVHSINYYTGMIFRGITASLGRPLLSGGRYDELPSDFDRPMPAVGFGVDIKQLLISLERQGDKFEEPVSDILLAYDIDSRSDAIALAMHLRGQGKRVELCYGRDMCSLYAVAEEKGVARAIFVDAQGAHEKTCGQ